MTKPTFIGTGQTLTDLERNNRILDKICKVLYVFAILFAVLIGVFLFLVWKVLKTGAIGEYIAHCV